MFDMQSLGKYLIEGLALAVAAYVIPQRKLDPTEIILIALTAAATFAVLDMFSPLVSVGARQGAGFGMGYRMVGGGDGTTVDDSYEGFDGCPVRS